MRLRRGDQSARLMREIAVCHKTAVGLRDRNEDRVCTVRTRVFGESAVVLAVADGMGGMNAGDEAAELAISTVSRHAAEALPQLSGQRQAVKDAVARMCQEANRSIWELAQARGLVGQVGTTLVYCLAFGGRYLVANAGDSRCYYLNNYEARQLTEDHSQVQEMVRQGALSPEAARRSPYRNMLTKALGEPDDVQVDLIPNGTHFGVIDEACALVLTSDGLHGELAEADILGCLRSTRTIEEMCDSLIALALQRGSSDNISVAAVEFGRLRRDGDLGRRPWWRIFRARSHARHR